MSRSVFKAYGAGSWSGLSVTCPSIEKVFLSLLEKCGKDNVWPDSLDYHMPVPQKLSYVLYTYTYTILHSVWISTTIHGLDEQGRMMRRTIARYLNLSLILALRLMCLPVMKRFPTLNHLVEAGILTEGEKKVGVASAWYSR